MDLKVVIKLVGRNIGFTALQNRISNLWRPTMLFHLMDIENSYYLPWSMNFDPANLYPSLVKSRVIYTITKYNGRLESWWESMAGKELCPTARMVVVEEEKQSAKVEVGESNTTTESMERGVNSTNYGPWMLVEKKFRKKSKEDRDAGEKLKGQQEDDMVGGVSGVFNKGRKGGLKLGPNGMLDKGINCGTIGPNRSLNGGQAHDIMEG
ncbi:hypothetical protein Godav_005532, partial [Gossypium davidsonii]|nr:hypothetical protein [Gossypium davidsonii]